MFATTPRQIRWYDLLTLDHSVCRVCFSDTKYGRLRGPEEVI